MEDEEVVDVILKAADRECHMDVCTSITVGEMREVVAIETNIPSERQRLIYRGRILTDSEVLSDLGVKSGHKFYVVASSSAQSSPAAASSPSPAPATASLPSTPSPAARRSMEALAASMPRPAPTTAGQSPFGGPQSMMGMMQQSMLDNPEMMRQMMESPMMQSFLSNPEIIRHFCTSNPEIRALIESNPEVGHALNDPEFLQRSLQMMRNPSLMLEMQRNADRTMQHLELMPEGFNSLRRMYSSVASPMEEAAARQMQAAANPGNPGAYSALLANSERPPEDRPNDVALPNPWGPLPPAPAAASPFGGAAGMNPFMGGPAGGFGGMGGFPFAGMFGQPRQPAGGMFPTPMQQPGADLNNIMQYYRSMMMAGGQGNTADATGAANSSLSDATIRSSLDEYQTRFSQQISAIREMGMDDSIEDVIRALVQCDGDVSMAVERLLGTRFT